MSGIFEVNLEYSSKDINDSQVTVWINLGGMRCDKTNWPFTITKSSQADAELFRNKISGDMQKALRAIRANAYYKGRQDVTSHRKRLQDFSGEWNPDIVGW